MKDATGIQWLILFLSQIIFSPLVQVLIYKYVAVTQYWQTQTVSFFRTLFFVYLVPFLVGVAVVGYTLLSKYNDANKGPYQMTLRQIAALTCLSIFAIMTDYAAIVSYSSMPSFNNLQSLLEFKLPLYLILKLTMTPIFAHLFGSIILKRFFAYSTLRFLCLQVFGIFVYEFTVWDTNPISTSYLYAMSSEAFFGGFRFNLPEIYTYSYVDADGTKVPHGYQWLPFFLVIGSSICNGLIPVLSKSYMIQHAHSLKLNQYQHQKVKLKDGQLNVQFLDKDMLLKPKLVT